MTFSDTAMMGLGITQSTNIHKTRSVIRTLKYVLDISQTEGAFTVEEHKTHTQQVPSTFVFVFPFTSLLRITFAVNSFKDIVSSTNKVKL